MRGHDLVMPLPLTVGEAVCGAKVEVRDIDGEPVTFKVPAGSSSGAEIRVAGKGVQSSRGAGDLIGRVEIRVPAKPGMGLKRAAKEFDKESAVSPRTWPCSGKRDGRYGGVPHSVPRRLPVWTVMQVGVVRPRYFAIMYHRLVSQSE